MSPDNFIQDPYNTQSFNRYSYVWNNPLRYNDPSGEVLPLLAVVAIGFATGAAIDYGMQVAMNHLMGVENPWLSNIDFFDIAVSGVVSGLTAGFGGAVSSGKTIGKFGKFILENTEIITLTEIAITSAVDITKDGLQEVSFGDFNQRLVTGAFTYGATKVLTDLVGKALKPKRAKDKVIDGLQDSTDKFDGLDPIEEGLAKANSESLPAEFYPTNDGALGNWTTETLQPGTRIDRYGQRPGRYFSPENTLLDARALPVNSNTDVYQVFEVVKPFTIQKSIVAPAFGKPGFGIQYKSPVNSSVLLKRGIIQKLF